VQDSGVIFQPCWQILGLYREGSVQFTSLLRWRVL